MNDVVSDIEQTFYTMQYGMLKKFTHECSQHITHRHVSRCRPKSPATDLKCRGILLRLQLCPDFLPCRAVERLEGGIILFCRCRRYLSCSVYGLWHALKRQTSGCLWPTRVLLSCDVESNVIDILVSCIPESISRWNCRRNCRGGGQRVRLPH